MQKQITAILESGEWDRLAGTILLIPTENDPRPKGVRSNRQTHLLQVYRIADSLADHWQARNAEINRGVVRVAALAHDLAHLPFGHYAEAKVLPSVHQEVYKVSCLDDAKRFFKHELNGCTIYKRIMDGQSLAASEDVCSAIREHRRPHEKKTGIESAVVAIADDIATLVSNLVDGAQLPGPARWRGLYPMPVWQALVCEFGGDDDPRSWERHLVGWVRPWTQYQAVLVTNQPEFGYVIPERVAIFHALKRLADYHVRSPEIRADNLGIDSRVRAFWARCASAKLAPEFGLQNLLRLTEEEVS